MAMTRLFTVEDFEQMTPDDARYELMRGELQRMAAAGGRTSAIAVGIAAHLWNYVVPRRLGMIYGADAGFVLSRDPDTVFVPDAAFVRADRLPSAAEQDGILRLRPDLAVEVVSPTDRGRDVATKIGIYLDAGVSLVWVVEPRQRRVTVHSADRMARIPQIGDELDGGDVLPGFRLTISDIFRD